MNNTCYMLNIVACVQEVAELKEEELPSDTSSPTAGASILSESQ